MLKSGDKVVRIHPLYEGALIEQGKQYVVDCVDSGPYAWRINLKGADPTVYFLMEAFEKVED